MGHYRTSRLTQLLTGSTINPALATVEATWIAADSPEDAAAIAAMADVAAAASKQQ